MSEHTIDELIDSLGDLYSVTGVDWELSSHHILTEPVCPSVTINPEGWNIARYMVSADTLEGAIRQAIAHVWTEIVERKVVGGAAPWTNSHDKLFESWLIARAAGSDEYLPDLPPP